jgi:uroporphyrinogen-III synthase
VVLTRSPEDNARLRALAAGLDVEWVERTCLAYEQVPAAPEVIDDLRAGRYDGAVFPSRRAVEGLFASGPLPAPSNVVAVGPSTREALGLHGWVDVSMPHEASAAAVVEELDALLPGARHVLYVRGETATDDIQAALRARSTRVTEAVVYRSRPLPVEPLPDDNAPTLVVVASPESARAWLAADATTHAFLAIGKSTAAAIRAARQTACVAPEATAEGLAKAVRAWRNNAGAVYGTG